MSTGRYLLLLLAFVLLAGCGQPNYDATPEARVYPGQVLFVQPIERDNGTIVKVGNEVGLVEVFSSVLTETETVARFQVSINGEMKTLHEGEVVKLVLDERTVYLVFSFSSGSSANNPDGVKVSAPRENLKSLSLSRSLLKQGLGSDQP